MPLCASCLWVVQRAGYPEDCCTEIGERGGAIPAVLVVGVHVTPGYRPAAALTNGGTSGFCIRLRFVQLTTATERPTKLITARVTGRTLKFKERKGIYTLRHAARKSSEAFLPVRAADTLRHGPLVVAIGRPHEAGGPLTV